MSLLLIELAFLGGLILHEVVAWRRLLKDISDPLYKLRAAAKAELSSLCGQYGHDLNEDGCYWCSDVQKWYATFYRVGVFLDPAGVKFWVSENDRRVIHREILGKHSFAGHQFGYAYTDSTIPAPKHRNEELPAIPFDEQQPTSYHARHETQAEKEAAALINRTGDGDPFLRAQERQAALGGRGSQCSADAGF